MRVGSVIHSHSQSIANIGERSKRAVCSATFEAADRGLLTAEPAARCNQSYHPCEIPIHAIP